MKKKLFTIALMAMALFTNAQMKPNFNDTTYFRVTEPYTGIGFYNKKIVIFTIHQDIFEKACKELKSKIIDYEIEKMPFSYLSLKEYAIYFNMKDSVAIKSWGNRNL
jgi:hypothetical protein